MIKSVAAINTLVTASMVSHLWVRYIVCMHGDNISMTVIQADYYNKQIANFHIEKCTTNAPIFSDIHSSSIVLAFCCYRYGCLESMEWWNGIVVYFPLFIFLFKSRYNPY